MHTNVYTAEQHAKARYSAELNKAQYTHLVRQAEAQHRQRRAPTRSARWIERVIIALKSAWAGVRGLASTPVQ